MAYPFKSVFICMILLAATILIILLINDRAPISFLRSFKHVALHLHRFEPNKTKLSDDQSHQVTLDRNDKVPAPESNFFKLMEDRKTIFKEPFLHGLTSSNKMYCSNNLEISPKGFARLKDVYIDPSEATGRKGGDSAMKDTSSVYNPKSGGRVWLLKSKFFQVLCPGEKNGRPISQFTIGFQGGQYFANSYRSNTVTMSKEHFDSVQPNHTIPGLVVALSREHFHNMYHNIADLYNVFALSLVYKLNVSDISILFIDGHEYSPQMEPFWKNLFSGRLYRIGHMKGIIYVKNLLWTLFGNSSPTHDRGAKYVPFINEFRTFLLNRFGIYDSDSRKLNCSRVRVTFMLRRQFGRPQFTGPLKRNMANEQEVIKEVKSNFPNIVLSIQTFVNVSMRDQLKVTALETDILMGMHGAGFAHVLFMQQHGALIEFFPRYYWDGGYVGYTRFRKLIREEWKNTDPKNELPGERTRIPPGVATQMLQKVLKRMGCQKD